MKRDARRNLRGSSAKVRHFSGKFRVPLSLLSTRQTPLTVFKWRLAFGKQSREQSAGTFRTNGPRNERPTGLSTSYLWHRYSLVARATTSTHRLLPTITHPSFFFFLSFFPLSIQRECCVKDLLEMALRMGRRMLRIAT